MKKALGALALLAALVGLGFAATGCTQMPHRPGHTDGNSRVN